MEKFIERGYNNLKTNQGKGTMHDKGYIDKWYIKEDIYNRWKQIFIEYNRIATCDKKQAAKEFQEKEFVCI